MRKAKVALHLENRQLGPNRKPWPPGEVETLWVELVDEGRAKLINIPFFANNLAFLDEIGVEKRKEDEPFLTMTEVLKRSGNGTVRAILAEEKLLATAEAALDAVEKRGCNFETGQGVAAINIPKGVSPDDVLSALEPARKAGAIYVDVGFIPSSA